MKTAPILAALLLLSVDACGGEPTDSGGPDDAVVIGFSLDDRANRTYGAGDGLAWKGSFSYDAATGVVTFDPAWSGPFPLLWDDGAGTAGGHEPAGATAGDNIWGVAVRLAPPTGDVTFAYGAIRGSVGGGDGDWIWKGPNGSVTVRAGQTAAVTAAGLTISPFGDVDLRLTLDLAALHPDFAGFDPQSGVAVKGDPWGWSPITLLDDGTAGDDAAGDGVFTLVLSQRVGAGTSYPNDGLLRSLDVAEFVFVLGGVQYRVGGTASGDGVAAFVQAPSDQNWSPVTIGAGGSNGNSYVTVP
jgi:hypothetical protein